MANPTIAPSSTAGLPPDLAGKLTAMETQQTDKFRPQVSNTAGLPPDLAGQLTTLEQQTPPPKMSNTGLTQEPMSGWQAGVKNLADHYTLGVSGINQSVAGWKLATSDQPFDEAMNSVQTHDVVQAQTESEDYTNSHTYAQIAGLKVGGPGIEGGWLAEQVPALGLGLGGMAIGAGTAKLIGAPLLGGATIGGALVSGTLSAGNTVYGLMQRGVDRDTARVGGLAAGLVGFATGMVGVKNLTGGSNAVLEAVVTSPQFKQAAISASYQMAKSMGIQISLQQLNSLSDSTVKYVAIRAAHGAKPFTIEEAATDFIQSGIKSLVTAPALVVGTHGAGALAGAAIKPFVNHVEAIKALQAELDLKIEAMQNAHAEALQGHIEENVSQEPQTDKSLAEAEATNAQLRESSYIKMQIEKAVLATRVLKGAAQKVLAAAKKAQSEGRALTEDERLALDKKTFLEMDSTKIKSKLERGIQALTKSMPWSRSAGYANVTFGGILKIAFQDVPNSDALVKTFDTGVAVDHYDALHNQYNEKLYGHISEATGLNNAGVAKLAYKAPGDIIEGNFKGADGTDQSFQLSADDIMSYLMWMKNKKAKVGLRDSKIGNNFTLREDVPGGESTQKVFEDALQQADPNYLNAIVGLEAYWKEMGPLLKDSVKRLEGRDIGVEENHGGTIVRKGMVEREQKDLKPLTPGDEFTFSAENVEADTPGFIEKREASKLKIEPRGAFANATQRARRQAGYEAFTPPSRLWNGFVQSGELKHAITTKFGKHVWDALESGYEDTVLGIGKAQDEHAALLNTLLRMQAIHWFALKPQQYFKHLMTVVNFALYKHEDKFIPPDKLLSGIADANLHWGKVSKEILSWPEVETRYTNTDRLGAFTTGDSAHPTTTNLLKGSMWFLKEGDKPALIAGTHAVYKYILEQTGDHELAKAEAVSAFKNVLASGSIDQLSVMSKHPVGRLMVLGQQPRMRLAQHVLEARRQAANFPTPENLSNAVRVSVISQLSAFLFAIPDVAIAGGLAAAVGGAYKNDVNEAWFHTTQDLLLGNMFPVLGWLCTSSNTYWANATFNEHHHVFEFSVPAVRAAASTQKFVADFAEHSNGKKEWTPKDIMTTFLHAVQGPGALAPIPETPVKGLEKFTAAVYPN